MHLSAQIIAICTVIAALIVAVDGAKVEVPNYYLIRHAEKNQDGTLSAAGLKRTNCLISVFGKDSKYNIQHIMTQIPYPGDSELSHTTQRPYNTTLALAESLGITIDHTCNFTDTSCAGRAALQYSGPGNVLIAWEHDHLPAVAKAIGANNVPKYPSSHFDLIYQLAIPYTNVNISSEDCPQDITATTATTTAPAGTTTTKASSAVFLNTAMSQLGLFATATLISIFLSL